MKNTPRIKIIYALLFTVMACSSSGINGAKSYAEKSKDFKKYWYGGAEITRYDLSQVRYGEVHKGNAVMVFVTEDLMPQKQVKSEDPKRPKSDVVPVLKLNFIKKFNTGIYSYSIMNSIFTPVDIVSHPKTLKVSFSSQEWCGNMYAQLNLRNDGYEITNHSYFEKEADRKFEIDDAFLEDEVWTRIRLAPLTLPVGRVKMVPGTAFSMLKHIKQGVEDADASLEEKGSLSVYSVDYKKLKRKLTISFKKDFPHEILSWTCTNGADGKGETLITKAVKTHSMMTDYWSKNHNKDSSLRQKLGLD